MTGGMLPNENECEAILKEAGCDRKVISHCRAVEKVAMAIARRLKAKGHDIDERLISVGALVHDIGRSRTHGIHHGLEGAAIAKERGWDDRLVRLIEVHIGAGLPEGEAVALGLPKRDFIPMTLEEKVVAQADNLVSNDMKHPVEKTIARVMRRGFVDGAKRIRALHDEMSRLCGMDLDDIEN